MSDIIETVLLLALPASGKSEVRRYLDLLPEQDCRARYHLGPTAQLDDYPYVHLMRVIDETLERTGQARLFFAAADRGYSDPRDWETLIALVNEDYEELAAARHRQPSAPARWALERIDRARTAVGGRPVLAALAPEVRAEIEAAIAPDVESQLAQWNRDLPQTLAGRTVVIEFARGGPQAATLPLAPHLGYRASLARLSAAILERACILYIWVTPAQSRAKNLERARPDADGSILFHGVPEHVMRNDYGCDDLGWLLERSVRPGTVQVETRGRVFHVPTARFDNRTDLTTFLRDDAARWSPEDVARLAGGLGAAFEQLWRIRSANHP
jgi:hypothetical protein